MKILLIINKIKISAFSLVEILVVLGLFSSVATLSLGALFNVQAVNGRLQETQAILDNINLSTQTITRDIRFGSEFYCSTTIPSTPAAVPTIRKDCAYGLDGSTSGSVLIFKSSDATSDLDRTVIYTENGILYEKIYPQTGDPVLLQMTADNVNITSLTFYVEGAQTSDGSNDFGAATDYKQPLVTFLLSGVTRPSKTSIPSASFTLQSNISSRVPDNK